MQKQSDREAKAQELASSGANTTRNSGLGEEGRRGGEEGGKEHSQRPYLIQVPNSTD